MPGNTLEDDFDESLEAKAGVETSEKPGLGSPEALMLPLLMPKNSTGFSRSPSRKDALWPWQEVGGNLSEMLPAGPPASQPSPAQKTFL